jgi:RNA polymerase-binding transcription factor
MDRERAAALLARERERIERELSGLRHGSDDELSHVDQHLADQGSELYEDERDEGLALRLREELGAIERAERRLEEGTFGRSIESGEPIPDGRLEAIPWAELTVDEQSRRERGG